MSAAAVRVLLVEDEPVAQEATARFLEASGHLVQRAGDADTALALAGRDPPDVLVCDCNLAEPLQGLAVARRIQAGCGAAVILTSGHPAATLAGHLEGLRVAATLQKPLSLAALAAAVAAAVNHR